MKMIHLQFFFSYFFFFLLLLVPFLPCGAPQQGGNGGSGDGDDVLDSSIIAPMELKEKEALYKAIQGFVGNSWNGSDLYPDPCGWTPIQGVSCDIYNDLWYVSTISMGPIFDNSLTCNENAKLTPHLFELKHLTSLSIYNCFMSPNHNPTTLSNLSWEKFSNTLQSLEFRSNPGLIGTLPSSIGQNLKELESLVLLENGLTGQLPIGLGSLVRLRKLVLSTNKFSGHIPDSFGGLNNLLILDLSRNNLSGPLPWAFGNLMSLIKLDLSNNGLEGHLPLEIGNLKNLTLLDLGSNRFSGGLIWSSQEMVYLQEMVMSNNPIGGDLMRIEWKNLRNLRVLDLSNTGLEGNIPESLAELKSLRFLGLRNNSLTGIPPKILAAMPCLSALYINWNNLTGELEFPGSFYAKIGWRFGASNNPNLCFRPSLKSSVHVPYGVKPCLQELTSDTIHMGSFAMQNEDDSYWSSQGYKNYPFGAIQWTFMIAQTIFGVAILIILI